MPFSTLGLSPALTSPLARLGYTRPTPVQAASIPVVLTGSDLLARAQTGTGKTAAFGLPMIDRLLVRAGRFSASRKPRGLVLVPTRELAVQVHASLVSFGLPVKLRAAAIYGGVGIRPQIQALQRGIDIVVATPGRLLDHVQQRTIDLSGVEILTLDEADRMLDMGFLPPLRQIARLLPRDRQTLLLSATFAPEVVKLASEFTRDPVRVDVSASDVVATTVTHRVYPVGDGRKNELLAHVLKLPPVGQTLVFCKTKRGSNRVGEYLESAGINAAVIHGNKSQSARQRALDDFKAGRVAVLVATDIAARGLDIAELPLVVNFDLPLVAADYVHRVGRTGRAGLAGRAVSLLAGADRGLLRDIQKLLPETIEEITVASFSASRPTAGPRPPARYGDRRRTPQQPRRFNGRAAPRSHRRPAEARDNRP
ncbi:MAG TPA: DEAD/DEAH box helicase [Vicinamibacterales bacterium]|nr:DEAD/DEAH box helicase [Vicinamibacterales bacterium]